MKKRKGFTLVELLVVIAILAVILLIAVPIIVGNINESKEKTYGNQISLFKEGAKRYALEHEDELKWTKVSTDEETNVTIYKSTITLRDLADKDYVDLTVINLKTGYEFDPYSTVVIVYKNADGSLTFEYQDEDTFRIINGTVSQTSIPVKATGSGTGTLKYRFKKNSDSWGAYSATATTTFSGLAAGTKYTLYVEVIDAVGQTATNKVEISTAAQCSGEPCGCHSDGTMQWSESLGQCDCIGESTNCGPTGGGGGGGCKTSDAGQANCPNGGYGPVTVTCCYESSTGAYSNCKSELSC